MTRQSPIPERIVVVETRGNFGSERKYQSYLLEQLLYNQFRLERKIDALQQTENQEVADLTQLTADVAANGDAISSAVQLLVTLHDEIVNAGTDPAALAALAEQLEQNTQSLAAAVVENTPSATP